MSFYTEEYIVEVLNSIFDSNTTKAHLQQCKPDFVQSIYISFLKDFGANIEKIGQVPFDAPQSFHQYPDMHRSSSFVVCLASCIKYYLKLIYDNDEFTINDLFHPVWSRTKVFFSLFIEFYEKLVNNNPLYLEVENELSLIKEEIEKLRDEHKMLKSEIHQRELDNAENQICLEQEMQSIELVKEEIEGVHELKTRMKGRLEGLKSEFAELVTKTKETELHILEDQDRIKMLRTMVIGEGEFQDIKEREEKLLVQKTTNDQLKEALKELTQGLELQQLANESVKNTLLPALEDYKSELKKKEERLVARKEVEKGIANLVEREEELSRSLQMISESLFHLEDERIKFQRSMELKVSGSKEEIEQMRLTLEELNRGVEENEIVAKDLDSEHQKVVDETRALEERLTIYVDHVRSFKAVTIEEFKKCTEDDIRNYKAI